MLTRLRKPPIGKRVLKTCLAALIVALFLSIPYWKENAFRKKAVKSSGGAKNA